MTDMLRSAAVLFSALAIAAGCQAADATEVLRQLDDLGRTLVERPCANPGSTRREAVKNRHDPAVVDELRTIRCPGLTAQAYVANATCPPRVLPLQLAITSPARRTVAGLQVGAPAASLQRALGKPDTSEGDVLSYTLPGDSGSDTVAFTVRQGRISRIEWSWDVD